jgi:hypothetical protein
MAEPNIVGSLFGVTPELYQEQRDLMRQKQAMEFAQQDPRTQATYAFGRAGQQLGQAFGGLMGVEDPQMRLISQRNALAKQIDMNDPESIMRGAQMAAQSGDTAAATALADYARRAASELALAQQRTAEKMTPEQRNARAESDLTDRLDQLTKFPQSPERDRAINLVKNQLTALTRGKPEKVSDAIQIAREVGVLTDALAKTQEGTPEYNSIKAQIDRLQKPEKDLRFGVDREAYAEEKFSKPFAQLTPEEKATVNRYIEGEKSSIAEKSAIKVYPPGTPIPQKDWIEFRKFADSNPIMKKTTALISEAPNAIETIGQVTTNDIAAKALPATLARLTGDTGVLSNQDITRYARTGGLDDRLAQSAAQFFTGRGTAQQKDQAMRFVSAIYRGALIEQRQFIVDEAKQLGYTGTSNYDTMLKTIDDKLAKFKEVKPGTPQGGTPKPAQPTGNPLIDKYLVPANTPQ